MSVSQATQYPYPDRTEKQPLVWRCVNPRCVENYRAFEFESDDLEGPECPKCGCKEPPTIQLRALIHLLVPDRNGKIKGMYGRYKIACDAKRAYISTGRNNEAASDNIDAVNCPDCLVFGRKSRIVDALGRRISLKDFTVVAAKE